MIIYKSDGTPIIHLDVDDTSYAYREIMGDCKVYLEFALTQHVELPIGAYVDFQGERYMLMSVADVTIQHNRDYEYKVTFEGRQARFQKYRVHNPVDGRLVFEMVAKPQEHLAMIVANLTEREGSSSWAVGVCIDGPEKAIAYNHTKLNDALTQLANAYDTEWEVSGNSINLNRVEYNTDAPLALGYGRNLGFKPGVGRSNYGETGQIERLNVQGGDSNISQAEYGNSTLLLPKGFSFKFDGEKFKYVLNGTTLTETGFDASKAVDMVTDANGYSVALASAPAACNEESLDLTHIYPKRVGKVTAVRYLYNHQYLTYAELMALDNPPSGDDWLNVQVDIIDSEIPASLDYADCLLANDEPLTVIFQTGMLAGREFSATFRKAARTQADAESQADERPANRFELVRANFNGLELPNATYRPNADSRAETSDDYKDTYIVVNCYLPQSYICDKATFSGAEMEMLREAAKYLFKNKDIQLTFKGQLDDLYSKRNWLNVGGKLVVGGCVSFTHSQVQADPLVTRIVAMKQFINNPYAPELTLSNESVKGGLSSRLSELGGGQAHVLNHAYALERYTKRSFRDAKETMEMIAAAAIGQFTEGISPITVQTMQMLVGDESLQFRYVNAKTNPQPAPAGISYNQSTRKLICNAGIIQHMTLGIDALSNLHADSEYRFWDITRFESPYLGDALADKKYYLYAKCSKADSGETGYQTAEYVLSETAIGMNSVTGYWHLLVGILNSEYDGERSFVTLFGFTEILPGRITTDKIVSSDGTTYWDLVQKVLQLGSYLRYDPVNGLVLHGALVQTGSGELTLVGAWCGEFNATRRYTLGDEVWANVNGVISTYRYVNSVPSDEVPAPDGPYPPVTNTSYWQCIAKGIKGETGQSSFKSTVFCRTNSTPKAPAANQGSFAQPNPPTGTSWQVYDTNNAAITGVYWSDGIPAGSEKLWATTRIFSSDGQSPQQAAWSTPRQMTDTDTFDVEFAKMQTNDAVPATPTAANRHGGSGTQVWFDPDLDSSEDFTNMYWRAERECVNGVWGSWTIVRIKGETGNHGKHTAVVHLYKRAASAPSIDWNNDLTYSFVNNALTSEPTGWSQAIPADNGLPLYVTAATATSTTDTDKIAYTEWATPVKFVEDGLNVATVTLYKRAASAPSKPTGTLTYTFATGALSGNSAYFNGWSQAIPAVDGNPCYVIQATAISTTSTDDILSSEWSEVKKLVEDGKGISSTVVKYAVSSSGTVPPVGENLWKDSLDQISISPGYYVWTRTVITYTDNSSTTQYSVAYSGTNGTPGGSGTNGYSTKFLYKSQATRPDIPTGTSPSPSGWSTEPAPAKVNSSLSNTQYSGQWTAKKVALALLFKRASSAPTIDWTGSLTISLSTGKPSTTPSGWSQSIPSGTDTLYVTWALVTGTGSSVSVAKTAWATPEEYDGSGLNVESSFAHTSAMLANTIDHSQSTVEQFFFKTAKDNVHVQFMLVVASECNYDWLYVSDVDDNLDIEGGKYNSRFSSDESGVPKLVTIDVLVKRAGSHKIEFGYGKDGSGTDVDHASFMVGSIFTEQKIWMTSCKVQDGVASEWTTPLCINGEDGINGGDGPACPYRGVYDENETYFGMSTRTDIVRYTSGGVTKYYRANPCVGGQIRGIVPTNQAYWMDFGAQFSNIATGFLFAEEAVIEKGVIRILETSDTGARIIARDNALTMLDGNLNTKLSITGEDLEDTPDDSQYTVRTLSISKDPGSMSLNGTLHYEDLQSFTLQQGSYVSTFEVESDVNAVKIPDIDMELRLTVGTSASVYGQLTWYGYMELRIDDDIVGGYATSFEIEVESGDGGAHTITERIIGRYLQLSKGNHTLKLYVNHWLVGSNFSSDDIPDLYICAPTITNGLRITYPAQVTAIGANGFRAMFSGNQKAEFIKVNGSVEFLLRNGNYGIKLTSSGMMFTFNGGTNWYYGKRNSSGLLELSTTA